MPIEEKRLPLGAVRTTNGDVVVPASHRADGSMRKPIRIRQGYTPQDEVPKYKTVMQRRREKVMDKAVEIKADSNAAIEELLMDKLSLEQKKMRTPATKEPRFCNSDKALYEEKMKDHGQVVMNKRTETTAISEELAGDQQQRQLKQQLTQINKQLKKIAKLENMEKVLLSKQEKQKIAQKTQLQQQRHEIIAELNGATVTKSSSSMATGSRPKVVISL
ncbi:unnamed protein product [Peronospora belbahrii]|uniref:WIBG Mago-binding domain-containing protein n=1 Tax=Peronospora belbahrii TaxID=622444 RepID=A0AAU9L7G2_9STRA|nr:unnamed protein product [Peronospora belbahrii]CAH0518259.1 unnamed protein product [Peronospora belbahrii]